jgi:two-component system sensor histidine kinase KdpD
MNTKGIFRSSLLRYGLSVAAILLTTLALIRLEARVNATTVALTLLLVVLSAATFFGRNPALLASFAAMLCFNYFFLPPVHTWTISESQNLIAWAAFTITAIVAGELSEYARRRSRESKRLYDELQTAFRTEPRTQKH